MDKTVIRRCKRLLLQMVVIALAVASCQAISPGGTCRRVDLHGEVSAGQEWRAALGEGWLFRLLPIAPAGYSGWDLAVDRDPPAGYPDALLLATLPYNSINEREIGTTFGLRAQDAMGWNPRSFHFLSDPAEFREAQQWFLQLTAAAAVPSPGRGTASGGAAITQRLLQLQSHASSGQFRIIDAHLVPGIADPQPFAQSWAVAASRMQHEIEPAASGESSPLGKLVWMRFELTLWLPSRWNVPPALHPVRGPCQE